jgi:hypothetical protein
MRDLIKIVEGSLNEAPTIKSVTNSKGEIDRKKNERLLDPEGHFKKADSPALHEDGDPKALRARLRAIAPERKHLMHFCMNSANRAALALADGKEDEFASIMTKIEEAIRKAAEFDKESDAILAQLGNA